MFGSKKAGNLVFACSGKLSSVLNEMFEAMFYSLQAKTKLKLMMSNMPNLDPLTNPHLLCYRLLF